MTLLQPSRFSRRRLLSALGGAGAAAAFLPLLDADRASAATFPRRLVVMVVPEGTIQERFWPTGGETDFKLGPITSPLEPFRNDLLVLRGVDMKSAKDDPAVHGAHDNYVHLLAGVKSATGPRGDHNLGTAAVGAGGASLDQFLVTQLRPNTKLPSLVLGVQINWKAMQQARVSWSDFNQPVTPQEDPYKLFDTLFAGVASQEPTVMIDRTRAEDRSILDFINKDLKRVSARLAPEDRSKLDQHLAAIRDIERSLDPRFDAQTAGCAAPVIEGARLSVTSNPNFPTIGKVQMDLLAAALACDLTRISTFQWNSGVGNLVMSWLGPDFQGPGDEYPTRTLHDMTHRQRQTPAHTDRKARVEQWFIEQAAYFLGKLKSIKEGAGTLLDNTAVLVVNHMHDGAAHSHGPGLPCVLAGRCGGFFKTGRYIDMSKTPVPHHALLVSLAQAMGVDIGSFGDPAYNTRSLGMLRA